MAKRTTKLRIKQHKFNPLELLTSIKKQVRIKMGVKILKSDVEKCWNEEIKRLKDELIENGKTDFSGKLGSLCIYKEHISELSDFKRKSIRKSEVDMNRLGYHYSIVYEKNKLVNKKVRFVPCAEIIKRKKDILKNTNKDYKPAPLKNVYK